MIHINKLLKESSFRDRIAEIFLPEQYLFRNIMDFINCKSKINPTRKIVPMGCFYNGMAIIHLRQPVSYYPINELKGTIQDLCCPRGSLEVDLSMASKELRTLLGGLKENARVYNSSFLFSPEEDKSMLIEYNPIMISFP